MTDVAKIIGRLEARHRCPRDCDGTVAMTLGNLDGKQQFLYQCGTCGSGWAQNGSPLHRQEGER